MVLSAFSASISSNSSASLVGSNPASQIYVAGGFREVIRAGDEPDFFTSLAFACDINLRCRVTTHQHNGQSWCPQSGCNTRLNFLSNFRAHLLRNRFTVNNLCCHQREDSICYVGRRGCAYFVRSGARCQVSFQIYRVKRPLAKVRRTVAEVAEIESFIFRP